MSDIADVVEKAIEALEKPWGALHPPSYRWKWGPQWAVRFEAYLHEFGHLLDFVGCLNEGEQDVAEERASREKRGLDGDESLDEVVSWYLNESEARFRQESEVHACALVEVVGTALGLPLDWSAVRGEGFENWYGVGERAVFDAQVEREMKTKRTRARAWHVVRYVRATMELG